VSANKVWVSHFSMKPCEALWWWRRRIQLLQIPNSSWNQVCHFNKRWNLLYPEWWAAMDLKVLKIQTLMIHNCKTFSLCRYGKWSRPLTLQTLNYSCLLTQWDLITTSKNILSNSSIFSKKMQPKWKSSRTSKSSFNQS